VTRAVLELLDAAPGLVDLADVWTAVERAAGP
jgi:hypothetical protein